jgi:hypothetical protein
MGKSTTWAGCLGTLLILCSSAGAVSYPPESLTGQSLSGTVGSGIPIVSMADFPGLPRSWKLVAVTAGDTSSVSDLWFQDVVGNVYLLPMDLSQGRPVSQGKIYEIPAR